MPYPYPGTAPPGCIPESPNVIIDHTAKVPFKFAIYELHKLKAEGGPIDRVLSSGQNPMAAEFGPVGEGLTRKVASMTETVCTVRLDEPQGKWFEQYQVDEIGFPQACCMNGYKGEISVTKRDESTTTINYRGYMDNTICCPCAPELIAKDARAKIFLPMESRYASTGGRQESMIRS